MLLQVISVTLLQALVLCSDVPAKVKPYVFPIPFELPNRNDRADQCWLRIEDVELLETVAVYCDIAHAFLSNYIHDYNSRKMTDDGVVVSLWSEKPRSRDADILPPESSPNEIKDWRVTTVLDPISRMRLYVTKSADCRLIMYSREAMTNYQANCERILYFINVRMSGSAVFSREQNLRLLVASIFLVYLFM